MRIFHVSADRGIAPDGTKGASIHRRALIAALRRRGHEVVSFSRRPGGDAHRFGDAFDLVGHARAEGRPHLIYERYSIGHLGGLRAAERLEVPFVLEVNAPLLLEARRYRGYVPVLSDVAAELELFRRASLIRTVSTRLAGYVARGRGHDRRVVVIPNGHDPAAYPTAPHFQGPPTIAFLGHPKPWHGAERLVPLLADLRLARVDARLKVIGGGAGADRILADAGAAGVADRVEVTGPLDSKDVAQHLRDGWVGVAPYPPIDDFYFSPLKILDYLGAGLPVVASDLGDIGSLVGPGGTVVQPWSRPALANAVREFLVDPVRARATGRLGRERARTTQTWDQVVESIEAALPLRAAS